METECNVTEMTWKCMPFGMYSVWSDCTWVDPLVTAWSHPQSSPQSPDHCTAESVDGTYGWHGSTTQHLSRPWVDDPCVSCRQFFMFLSHYGHHRVLMELRVTVGHCLKSDELAAQTAFIVTSTDGVVCHVTELQWVVKARWHSQQAEYWWHESVNCACAVILKCFNWSNKKNVCSDLLVSFGKEEKIEVSVCWYADTCSSVN